MLTAFQRDPRDDFVGEWQVKGLSLDQLQRLFGLPSDDPMIGGFRVTKAQADALSRATGITVDLEQYDYFVEALAL